MDAVQRKSSLETVDLSLEAIAIIPISRVETVLIYF